MLKASGSASVVCARGSCHDPAATLAFEDFERTGWEQIATPYDGLFDAIAGRLAKSLLDAAGVQAGSRVLDVGCGPGYVGVAAAARGADVAASDIAASMIELASDSRSGSAPRTQARSRGAIACPRPHRLIRPDGPRSPRCCRCRSCALRAHATRHLARDDSCRVALLLVSPCRASYSSQPSRSAVDEEAADGAEGAAGAAGDVRQPDQAVGEGLSLFAAL